jgi:hypothetical protein
MIIVFPGRNLRRVGRAAFAFHDEGKVEEHYFDGKKFWRVHMNRNRRFS